MHDTDMDAIRLEDRSLRWGTARNVALAGSALIALLSASCCIVPIGLAIVGLGGAWLSFLGPFAAHREPILVFVSIVVGYLWLRMLWRRRGTPRGRLGTTLAVTASLAIVLAWTAPLWEREISGALLDIWANQP